MTERVHEPLPPHVRPGAAEDLAQMLRAGTLGARLVTAAQRGVELDRGAELPAGTGTHAAALDFAPPTRRAIG
ncbi:MAG: hypothetical protein ACKVU4_13440 [Phycisphaerales bacterium]